MREVQDASDAIDEDDAQRGEREYAAEAQADDRVRGELRHVTRSSPSRAVPPAESRPGAAWSVVGGVGEASIRVMGPQAVRERHRPAGLEVLDSVQGPDE